MRFQTRDQWNGAFWKNEIALAKNVFADTIPYDKIGIANVDMGSAVTVATNPVMASAEFVILWKEAYQLNIANTPRLQNTLIHELTHVWQANYGSFAMAYMAESVWAQAKQGNEEIWKDGYWEGLKKIKEIIEKGIKGEPSPWHTYRSKAYEYAAADIGKDWKVFNVEQQANIVENWFSQEDGNRSPKDNKYPYIKNNILAKSTSAQYTPIQNSAGYSAEIAKIQATLYNLGYLKDLKYVGGFMGNITGNAVRNFQKRNRLKVDGDVGTARSLTQIKLNLSEGQLVRAI